MNTLDRAIQIALCAPIGSGLDSAGEPHVLRPITALNMFAHEDDRVAAILSDVVSRSAEWTTLRLQAECFPKHVVDAVEALTRRDDETEEDAAIRASSNEIARRVRLKQLYTPDLKGQPSRLRIVALLAGFDVKTSAGQSCAR